MLLLLPFPCCCAAGRFSLSDEKLAAGEGDNEGSSTRRLERSEDSTLSRVVPSSPVSEKTAVRAIVCGVQMYSLIRLISKIVRVLYVSLLHFNC